MENSKPASNGRQLTRDDWLRGALETMRSAGIDGVKVAPLAERLGVTTGSFYWHFKNRRELLDLLLDFWERTMTDAAKEEAERFEGSPDARILYLMQRVMEGDLAGYDLPIWQWAQSDEGARKVFQRALKKRFEFTSVDDVTQLAGTIRDYVEEALDIEQAGLEVEPAPEPTFVEELQQRLDEDTEFRTAFTSLTPGRQREYNLYFSDAKQASTRVGRIDNKGQYPRVIFAGQVG